MQTTGKRLGQIVRFELQNPDSPMTPEPPIPSLGHLTPPQEDGSVRGSQSELRQGARNALEALLQGNARFRKVGFFCCTCMPGTTYLLCARVGPDVTRATTHGRESLSGASRTWSFWRR